MAHFLESAGRDYLVVDRASAPGSFFTRFPRFRQLISINKAFTGADDTDFVMRQDWNSFLSEDSTSSTALPPPFSNHTRVPCLLPESGGPPVQEGLHCFASDYSSTHPALRASNIAPRLRFTDWSSEYYPHADDLVRYIAHWASERARRGAVSEQVKGATSRLRVEYRVDVAYVERPPGYSAASDDVALGRPRFRVTSTDGRQFECTFLLWAAGLQRPNRADGVNVADVAESYWTMNTDTGRFVNKSVLILGRGNAAFEVASHVMGVASLVHVVGRDTGRIRLALETHYPGDVRRVHSNLLESYLLKSQDGLLELPQGSWRLERDTDGGWRIIDENVRCHVDDVGRPTSRCLLGRTYDIVISCPGFRFDASLFADDVTPSFASNGKHPALTPAYEAPGVRGLYFLGTLAHAADYRISSGGFIHGFRYVIRALHRHIEEEEQAAETASSVQTGSTHPQRVLNPPPAAWPRRLTRGLRSSAAALLRRAAAAAGPYQMFGSLVDVLVLPPLPGAAVKGFRQAGLEAPLVDPSSFYDPVDDSASPHTHAFVQWTPSPRPATTSTSSDRASEEAIDAATRGAIFEEVPVLLAPQKARGWSAQVLAALIAAELIPQPTALLVESSGAEFITLSLEFGGKSAHVEMPHGTNVTTGRRANVRAEWAEDPFALTRANVSVWIPEASRFLHPVLRYFNTGLTAAAVSELHLLEDFNNRWDHYAVHALSLTRWLQDVGARRAASVLVAAEMPHAVAKARREALIRVWMPVKRPSTRDPRFLMLRALLHEPFSTLFYGGKMFRGGEAWFHSLSVRAAEELLVTGPRIMTLHFVDTAPFPRTPAEVSAEDDAIAAMINGSVSARTAMDAAVTRSLLAPNMSLAEATLQTHADAVWRAWHTSCSIAAPTMPIVVVRSRAGLARDFGLRYGFEDGFGFRVYDARGPELRIHNVSAAQVLAEATAEWMRASLGTASAGGLEVDPTTCVIGGLWICHSVA